VTMPQMAIMYPLREMGQSSTLDVYGISRDPLRAAKEKQNKARKQILRCLLAQEPVSAAPVPVTLFDALRIALRSP